MAKAKHVGIERAVVPALIASLGLLLTSAVGAAEFNYGTSPYAQGAAAPRVAPATVRQSADRQYALTFRQLGAAYPLSLRGVDGRNGVQFSVRADEVVSSAKLHLEYSYSPSLLPDLSQINVMINEQTVASLPVPTDHAGTLQQATVDLPVHLISDYNRANIQLIGHYTLECEDPSHTSLWAIVSNDSALEFTVEPLRLENDLSLLPLPFFDPRSFGKLRLPVVFSRTLSLPKWEAAGVVASWFGGLAGFRGAEFPVSVDTLPEKGSAVVMLVRGDTIPGVTSADTSSPTVQMMDNPNDPYGKLLVITAADVDGLAQAARALAVGNQVMDGASVTITRFEDAAPRIPYDAPNWLRPDRAVSFGELVPFDNLSVRGYVPDAIRLPLRIPPDLFGWREKGIPIDLKYRYTLRPRQDQSTLNVSVGEMFVRAMPIPSAPGTQAAGAEEFVRDMLTDAAGVRQVKFHLPLFMLPSNTELRFQYYYEYIKDGFCRTVPLDNVEGTLDADSTIDISGLKHYLEMPDLAAFSNGGFPFSRMADLSETVVVVPNQPDPDVMQAYLGLMGRIGGITGYPATGVRVRTGADTAELEGNDILVLAAGHDQPLLATWADDVPFQLGASGNRFELANPRGGMLSNLLRGSASAEENRRIELVLRSQETQALVAGFESPVTSGRSVVILASTTPANLREAVSALVDPGNSVEAQLQGGFAVIKNGNQAETLITRSDYAVGDLGWWIGTRYYLSRSPLALVGLAIAGIFLLALIAYLLLRLQARRRLERP